MSLVGHTPAPDFAPGQSRRSNNAQKMEKETRDDIKHFAKITTHQMVKGGSIVSVLRYNSLAINNIRIHKENLGRIRNTISMKQHSMYAASRGLLK